MIKTIVKLSKNKHKTMSLQHKNFLSRTKKYIFPTLEKVIPLLCQNHFHSVSLITQSTLLDHFLLSTALPGQSAFLDNLNFGQIHQIQELRSGPTGSVESYLWPHLQAKCYQKVTQTGRRQRHKHITILHCHRKWL